MKASVICATYGHELYIGQCIESILAQSWQDWELIILDDGSPDKTREVISKYTYDPRIRYFHQENKGGERLAENYNTMVELATGDFVTILEGDDYAMPGLLEAHAASFKSGSHILSFNQVIVDEGSYQWVSPQKVTLLTDLAIVHNEPIGNALNRLFKECFIPAQGTSIRVEPLKLSGGFSSVYGLATVDYPTWLKLAQFGTFRFVQKPLAVWRKHELQATKQKIVPLTEAMIPVFFSVYEKLDEPVKNQLSFSLGDLKKHWAVQYTIILGRAGKYKLMVGDWKQAQSYFLLSFRFWPAILLTVRIKAILGLLFSYFHIKLSTKPVARFWRGWKQQ